MIFNSSLDNLPSNLKNLTLNSQKFNQKLDYPDIGMHSLSMI